jgi:hypothetical protein
MSGATTKPHRVSRRGRAHRTEAFHPLQCGEHFIVRPATLNGLGEQRPRLDRLSSLAGVDAGMEQGVRLAKPLGHRRPGASDMRPRPRMGPIQKQDSCPDVHRPVELSLDVAVEAKLQ